MPTAYAICPLAAVRLCSDPVSQRASRPSMEHQVIRGLLRQDVDPAGDHERAETTDTAALVIISSLAHGLIAEMSLG